MEEVFLKKQTIDSVEDMKKIRMIVLAREHVHIERMEEIHRREVKRIENIFEKQLAEREMVFIQPYLLRGKLPVGFSYEITDEVKMQLEKMHYNVEISGGMTKISREVKNNARLVL